MKKTYEVPEIEVISLVGDVMLFSVLDWQEDPFGGNVLDGKEEI